VVPTDVIKIPSELRRCGVRNRPPRGPARVFPVAVLHSSHLRGGPQWAHVRRLGLYGIQLRSIALSCMESALPLPEGGPSTIARNAVTSGNRQVRNWCTLAVRRPRCGGSVGRSIVARLVRFADGFAGDLDQFVPADLVTASTCLLPGVDHPEQPVIAIPGFRRVRRSSVCGGHLCQSRMSSAGWGEGWVAPFGDQPTAPHWGMTSRDFASTYSDDEFRRVSPTSEEFLCALLPLAAA
jgi:hypothetical protein